jgi:hypothetical protein
MSVKIFYKDGKTKDFTENECVVAQLSNASIVKIEVDNTQKADCFLSAVCDIPSYLVLPPVEIQVDHKNTIVGARIARKAKCASKRAALTWLVKEIVKNQANLESRLNDIILTIREKHNA